MLPLQKIRDLLPTAIVLASPQCPYQPLDPRWNLARSSWPLLGLRMTIEKAQESILRNPLEPEPNGLAMFPQMRCNLGMTHALLGQLKG